MTYAMIFIIVAFIGWAYETILRSVVEQTFINAGFLFLPFTPIYGFSILVLYLLFGTPQNPKFLSPEHNQKFSKKTKFFLYFFVAALTPTLFELFTGALFDYLFDMQLWTYSDWPLNFYGYICLPVSLFWGALITFFMSVVFDKILNLIQKIPAAKARVISFVIIFAIIIDFLIQLISLN